MWVDVWENLKEHYCRLRRKGFVMEGKGGGDNQS